MFCTSIFISPVDFAKGFYKEKQTNNQKNNKYKVLNFWHKTVAATVAKLLLSVLSV